MTVFCPDIADRLLLRQGEQSEIHRPIRAVDRVLAFDQQSATLSGGDSNAPSRNRTYNLLIKSQLLCQLSYRSGVR